MADRVFTEEEFEALEDAFSRSVFTDKHSNPTLQSKAVNQLIDDGMLEVSSDGLSYDITPLGHLSYCAACAQRETPEDS